MKRLIGTMVGLACAIVAVVAGPPDQVIERKVLSLAGARAVVAAAEAEAKKTNSGGAIAVVDDGGHLILLERLDNTFPAAAMVAIDKARTAATFRKATREFEDAVKNGRTSLLAGRATDDLRTRQSARHPSGEEWADHRAGRPVRGKAPQQPERPRLQVSS